MADETTTTESVATELAATASTSVATEPIKKTIQEQMREASAHLGQAYKLFFKMSKVAAELLKK